MQFQYGKGQVTRLGHSTDFDTTLELTELPLNKYLCVLNRDCYY